MMINKWFQLNFRSTVPKESQAQNIYMNRMQPDIRHVY